MLQVANKEIANKQFETQAGGGMVLVLTTA